MMSPEVYRSFVFRICLLGGESTGKSTLSQALSQTLNVPYVAEFGREYWEAKNGVLEKADLLHIAREQVRREELACTAPYLVCDTSPLTTLFYTLDQFGSAPQELMALAERDYALVVLCGDEFPFVQDGTRQGETFRRRQQAWYEAELKQRKIPFLRVRGSLSERIDQICQYIPWPD
jgi:NadR type nicotinamide-nucleotide adenylyltransferase